MRIFEYLKLKKKVLIILLISLFSLVVISIGTYYVVKMRQQPSKSSAGSGVSLYFDPANPTLGLNSNFTLNVKINPGSEKVTAAELYLTFDKDKIQITSIGSVPAFSAGVAPKTFLKDPVIDSRLGQASVIVGVLPEAPVGSVSDVVIVKGKTKAISGNALITITQDSKAAAIGKTSNVIETYGEASLAITAPTNTPTATPPLGKCEPESGAYWCSNHGGIALTVDHDVANWGECLSWCKGNMTSANPLCQYNGPAGSKNCWVNKPPTGGIDSCVWIKGTPPFGSCYQAGSPTETPTPTPTGTDNPTSTPTSTPTDSPTPTPTNTSTATPTASPTGSPSAKIGDVNGDGAVNLIDIGIVVDFYDMDVSLKPKADVNGDGSINLIDIGMIVDRYE